MKKNIEWLRNEIKKLQVYTNNPMFGKFDQIRLWDVEELINQLDEPEVLSKEWIDENEVFIFDLEDDCEIRYIPSLKLRHLLVPEQELPSVPRFVADYIDGRKEVGFPLYQAIKFVREDSRFEHSQIREWLWTNEAQEIFARAWLDGFTVKEEQKYIVVLGKSIYNTTTYGQIGEVNSKKIMQSMYANVENIITPNQYTKSEILEVKDGEDIFKRFAVKVEELEE